MCRCLIITSAVDFYLRSIFTAGGLGGVFTGRQSPLVYRAKLPPLGGGTPRAKLPPLGGGTPRAKLAPLGGAPPPYIVLNV